MDNDTLYRLTFLLNWNRDRIVSLEQEVRDLREAHRDVRWEFNHQRETIQQLEERIATLEAKRLQPVS
ncbi:hypothetical protein [Nocardioides sp. AE5]|uniref:hypothetical protein n=1 Tax=Nocardioides sp. AE5 TaxID=2962573 RepID=UPI00288121D9|nr:hypothetical protein [Nocardioides sp. AE5]MDT0203723.1 hypothetical protein [Nocardioides sp. AE5]